MLQPAEQLLEGEFAQDVAIGLGTDPKYLLAKYFYDDRGSRLFERVTELPEYYPTRTEAAILRENAPRIGRLMGRNLSLVELGSGSSTKTRILLESLLRNRDELTYLPIDISPGILGQTASKLGEAYPELEVTPIASQYESGLQRASDLVGKDAETPDRMLVLFLGSSIGNLEPPADARFLSRVRNRLDEGDAFLVGFDLVKDVSILNAAYNDAEGVTAEFNLNILRRINRELGGDFDLGRFSHRAFFNAEASRIEMHLVSSREHEVNIAALGRQYRFRTAETIHTESSYKYTRERIASLARISGFEVAELFTDERSWFALALLTPA
ncbi:MAG TPA: L-histidine N(alpha)-methyltransferase [Vicinamibacteria bacterium]|nr:L-histidine N(alpha)-methyltransferase [Vicinamibacteria bacterium]